MKIQIKETTVLLIIGGIRQIMDLFTGPFLITYFGRIATNPTVSTSIYNILVYAFLVVGYIFLGPLVTRKFRIGLLRVGMILNILYFGLYIAFGEAVVDYVGLFGMISGLAAAAYWYPLAMIKTAKITDRERAGFFAADRISITIVSVVGPILLGGLITGLSYVDTAIIVAVITVIQLALTLLLKPIPEDPGLEFHFIRALKVFLSQPRVRRVFINHIISGITISGMALRTVQTLNLGEAGLSELEIGYATAISSVVTILAVLVCNRRMKEGKSTRLYLDLCVFVPIVSFIFSFFTKNLFLYEVFFVLSVSLPCVLHTVHTIYLFKEVADGGQAAAYRGEYFAVLEMFLATGRILGCGMLIPVALSGNQAAMDAVTWVLVLFLGVFSVFTNRYRE